MGKRAASILGMLALAACQAPGPPTKPATTASKAPLAATTTPGVKPTPAPAPAMLKPPAGPYRTLTGAVQVDPKLLVAKGGTLLSDNGGAIAVAVGGAILSNNGSSLITDAGGSAIAGTSGNFVAKAGNAGGTAQVTAGGALVASGVITNNGSNLTGKVKYALQQVQDRPPTAGMLVSAVSLKTHKYVPVGVDGENKPVYAVYSNLKGGYELYLPQGEEGNVLVVASAPEVHDDALVCNAFTPVDASAAVDLDEDTALATKHVRRLFVQRVASLLTGNLGDDLLGRLGDRNAAIKPILDRLTGVVKARAAQVHVPSGPGAADIPEIQELCQLVTDAALAYLDYGTLRTSKLYSPEWVGPDEPTYTGLGDSFRLIRLAAERRSVASPTITFTIDRRNQAEASAPECYSAVSLDLTNPAVLGSYIQDTLVGDYSHPLHNSTEALRALAPVPYTEDKKLTPDDTASYVLPSGARASIIDRIDACQMATLGAILFTLSPPDWNGQAPLPPALQALTDLMDAYTATHAFSAPPAASPRPACL